MAFCLLLDGYIVYFEDVLTRWRRRSSASRRRSSAMRRRSSRFLAFSSSPCAEETDDTIGDETVVEADCASKLALRRNLQASLAELKTFLRFSGNRST